MIVLGMSLTMHATLVSETEMQYMGEMTAACPLDAFCVFFFFQAEDGIRDLTVTGVQTCALPIWSGRRSRRRVRRGLSRPDARGAARRACGRFARRGGRPWSCPCRGFRRRRGGAKIGRASCRGRGEISVVAGSFKKKKKNK